MIFKKKIFHIDYVGFNIIFDRIYLLSKEDINYVSFKDEECHRQFLKGNCLDVILIKAGRYGIGFAALTKLMGLQVTNNLAAQDFDWKKHSGTTIKLLMNKHPYMDSMIAELDNFKALTGMNVEYDIFAEDVYFDKVTAALSSKSSEYDAFMTGACRLDLWSCRMV